MPFARRDRTGRIVAITDTPDTPGQAPARTDDPDVVAFLRGSSSRSEAGDGQSMLAASDLQLIRVVEDLVDLLVRKNVIMFTELPREAQEKLAMRRRVRSSLEPAPFIADADDVL